MLEWLGSVGSIILIDLVLSGDNALVIGVAAANLPCRRRLLAILLGGGGAIVLRIAFAVLATFLLQIPALSAFGAVILLVIAARLLIDRSNQWRTSHNKDTERTKGMTHSFLGSLLTIVIADVTMSLDNVLAVGALASGNILVLVIGLVLSISILLLGSALVAELIRRLPWLLDGACLILAWTAGNMLLEEKHVGALLENMPWAAFVLIGFCIALILGLDGYLWNCFKRKQTQ